MREIEPTEDQLRDEEDEIFLGDVLTPLTIWRRGGYSDAELLEILKKSKKYAEDNATTEATDRLTRAAGFSCSRTGS